MRNLLVGLLLATMAVMAAGPAVAQTFSGMDFIKTGAQSYTDPNAWVEREFGIYDALWPENNLGTYHVPTALNGANIRNGANVTFNDGTTQYASNVAVGGTGEGIWDPNFLGDPNTYPFGYVSRPSSTLNISGASTTLVIDPNATANALLAGGFYDGTINMSGGSVNCPWLRIGQGMGASGYLNMSSGTIIARYRMNVGYVAGRTGSSGAGVTEAGGGYGEANLSGNSYLKTGTSAGLSVGLTKPDIAGLDPNGLTVNHGASGTGKFTISGNAVVVVPGTLDFVLGLGGSPANTWEDPNVATSWVQSKGTLIMTGGSIAVGDDFSVGQLSGTSIYAGGVGIAEITGGTINCDQFLVGSTTLAAMKGPGGKGTVRVGPNAVIFARNATNSVIFDDDGGDRNKLIIDVTTVGAGKISAAGNFAINTNNTALEMNAISFRPKQGDKYVVLDGVTAGAGSFSRTISNVTIGLDPNYVDANSNPVAFTGAWNVADYEVVFRGFTAGDAAGDGDVDLVDLGILGGNWNKTGQTWAQGDWSGDGVVGLLDLGALAANWNWIKPAGAPVPEPATMALLGLGGLALIRRKRS